MYIEEVLHEPNSLHLMGVTDLVSWHCPLPPPGAILEACGKF